MKKLIAVALVLLVAAQMTGCASVQRKFTRKPKEAKHVPSVIYVEQGPYQKKFSNDYYYKTHYTLWRTWQDELIGELGGNAKKISRSGEEAVSQLEQMKSYLQAEKAADLESLIADLRKAIEIVDRGMGDSQVGTIKVELERLRRLISHDFYYDKIKDYLVSDKVDLGDQTA